MSAVLQGSGLAIQHRLLPTDLALEAGTLTMLVGPNGAGKTSLLQAIAGIGEAAGEVRIGGEPLADQPLAMRARMLSYLSASRDAHWPLAGRDFVALGWPGRDAPSRAIGALASVEAEQFADRRVDRLSTGERARVMLARALVARSQILLLDEPIANLDPLWRIAVLDRACAEADRGAAVLMSVHDLETAVAHADRVIVMREGAIVADGPPAETLAPHSIAAYFGVKRSSGRWARA